MGVVPPKPFASQDRIIWSSASNGSYSTKSGYLLMTGCQYHVSTNSEFEMDL
ncbi:unnamed protein product, partial [Dovyalis caffra]